MESVTQLLQELVQIPSVNPDSDPAVSPGGEKAMADYLHRLLAPLGFRCEQVEVEPGRPNFIARAPGDENRPRILLGPHLDTVSVAGMTVDPFAAEISDGKMWGRGTSDTKGPMAAMLWGLIQNAERLRELPVAVDFVGFAGEESSQPGSRHFAEHHAADYEFAFIGEPTSMEIIHTTKGALWAKFTTKGTAAHSSMPELGHNAIETMARDLPAFLKALQPTLQKATHPILGPATSNLGVINGGLRPNIVPDHCEAVVDVRTTPQLVAEKPASQVIAAFLASNPAFSTLHLDPDTMEYPPMEVSLDHPWIQKTGLATAGAPWFSDAAHLNVVGLPAVCLGPGSITQAHTKDEFISLGDLTQGAKWFVDFIGDL